MSLAVEIRKKLETEAYANRACEFFNNDNEKFTRFKSVLLNIAADSKLQGCNTNSIISSAFSLAELNLDINPLLGQCYIVKYRQDAEPVISYKGWQTILKRTGRDCRAYSVFNCDTFELDLSDFEEKITFKPNLKERKESDDKWYCDNLLGVVVKIFSNSSKKIIFVSKEKIEKIKGKSPNKGQYSVYNSWAEEMYLAKAIKYTLSREPLVSGDENVAKSIALENQQEIKRQNEAPEVEVQEVNPNDLPIVDSNFNGVEINFENNQNS